MSIHIIPPVMWSLFTVRNTICSAFSSMILLFLVATVLAEERAYANEPEPEICQCAKALGYDESKDVLLERGSVPDKRKHCTWRFWQLFQPKPLEKIFSYDERRQYDQAIAQGKCDQATKLLSSRFDAARPDAPPHRSDESGRRKWEHSMSRNYYDSLGLCQDLNHLRWALKEIDEAGLKPRPFWNLRKNYIPGQVNFPKPVRGMYSAVGRLHMNMGRTQSPKVALAVLKISGEGMALKLHPHYEIYMAHRLRELGMTDPIIDEIIARPFDLETRHLIAKKAKRKDTSGIPVFPQDNSNLRKP